MIELKYLVTGTGRCGTVNLAMTLTSVGIPCSHERFFNGNSLEDAIARLRAHSGRNSNCSTRNAGLQTDAWDVKACASYLAAPYLAHSFFSDMTIIHVVRHPVKVILSFLNDIGFFWYSDPSHEHESFIYEHLPSLRDLSDPIDRAVHYYIAWNGMIRANARGRKTIFHPIEDGPATLLDQLSVPRKALANCYRNDACNTWAEKKDRYSPEDIQESKYAPELFALAARFGYAESPCWAR